MNVIFEDLHVFFECNLHANLAEELGVLDQMQVVKSKVVKKLVWPKKIVEPPIYDSYVLWVPCEKCPQLNYQGPLIARCRRSKQAYEYFETTQNEVISFLNVSTMDVVKNSIIDVLRCLLEVIIEPYLEVFKDYEDGLL